MAKFKLTPEQKDEVRRLTQKANRRILSFYREYQKHGLEILPKEPTAGIQTKLQWETKKYPLSRSVVFKDEKEYRERMKLLRSFDNPIQRETLTQYTKAQRAKTRQAMVGAIGKDAFYVLTKDGERVKLDLDDLSLGELKIFWQKFSDIARRMGKHYSSDQALAQTFEYFEEDLERLKG